MTIYSGSQNFAHCEKQDCAVSLDQTEGQCRDCHNCNDGPCPLEKQFGPNRFSRALNMLASGIGQSFTLNTRD